MLRSAPTPLGRCSSRAETTVASECRLHNLRSINQSHLPCSTGALAFKRGGLYEGAAQKATSHFLALRVNGKYPKFLFFVMNMHYKKLGRRLKLIVPKYRSDPVNHLEDIPEKVYSAELKPIVGHRCPDIHVQSP